MTDQFDDVDAPPEPDDSVATNSRRAWRTRRLIVLGAVGALLVAVAVSWPFLRGDDDLSPRRPAATFLLTTLTPKKTEFTLATIMIYEPGKTVEVLKLRPLTTPNIEFIGAVNVWPRDRDSIAEGGSGFPSASTKTYHPAIGTVVPAVETAFLHPGENKSRPIWVQAGYRIVSGELGTVNGVEVTYRVDGKVKSERSIKAVVVCMKPCKQDEQNPNRSITDWESEIREQLGYRVSDSSSRRGRAGAAADRRCPPGRRRPSR